MYKVAYEDRQFFDYGGWLAMYPMEELPYWRVSYGEAHVKVQYVTRFVKEHQEADG
ncbi:MAG: hypothetical protein M0C28_29605 [Candidatus Moduliflexus flocculans]|nr:hypothetical protein [Candidatus Moduliflexus flocculans]